MKRLLFLSLLLLVMLIPFSAFGQSGAMIKEKLKDLPAALLTAEAEVDSPDTSKEASGGRVRLTVPVKVGVDLEAYAEIARDLNSTMLALGYKPATVDVKLDGFGSQVMLRTGTLWTAHTGKGAPQTPELRLLGICELIDTEEKLSRWTSYIVPDEIITAFEQPVTFAVKAELLDAAGAVIATAELACADEEFEDTAPDLFAQTSRYPRNIIYAAPLSDSYMIQALVLPRVVFRENIGAQFPTESTLLFPFTFDLSEAEAQSIKSVRCLVSNVERQE